MSENACLAFGFICGCVAGAIVASVITVGVMAVYGYCSHDASQIADLQARIAILESNPNVPISEEEFLRLQEELRASP